MKLNTLLFTAFVAASAAAVDSSLRGASRGQRGLIIGGEATDKYDFFVQFAGNSCAGTLIEPDVVLTSAYCVTGGRLPGSVFIGAEAQNPNDDEVVGFEYEVECAKTHPDYVPGTVKNDIAVIYLKQRCNSKTVDYCDQPGDGNRDQGKTAWVAGLVRTSLIRGPVDLLGYNYFVL